LIEEPAKTALRRVRRAERPPRKVCRLCVEEDHVLGRNHDPYFTEYLCPKHHALKHDQMLDAGVDLRFQQNPVRRQVEILKMEAFYHRQQMEHHRSWADAKERQAEALRKYLEENTK
jgi:hypothetical protein